VKIVGAVSDEGSLEEIESIAKVFAYEVRMKQYASQQKTQVNQPVTQRTQPPIQRSTTEKPLHHSPVRGLC
jgi:hypothetical protein